jgi:hypothetical protein
MRAIQGAIVGGGLALVAVVAMALLIGEPGSMGPDPSRPSTQATDPRVPLVPTSPPEPVAAAEDTSVGTLPPPPGSSLDTQLVSRDLLAPSGSAPDARTPADDKSLDTRNARPAQKPAGQVPGMPGQDFAATQDGWDWDEWNWWGDPDSPDADGDDCRRYDRHTDCDRHN